MKILRYVAIIIWWVYLPDMTVSAQDIHISDPYANYPTKKAMYDEYSHWSIGLNGGIPFFAGNFRSMSLGNNYWGGMAGIQAGYQINPLFGVRMSVDYGVNKAGSKNYEDNFILLPDAETYYNVNLPEGAKYYRELYSSIKMWNVGLNFETNLFNLFRRSDGDRRWGVIVSPGIYLQRFSPTVKSKSDGKQFASEISNKLNIGLGGDLAVRYRVNRNIDLQLKGGMMWVNNNTLDGVKTICDCKHSSMVTVQAGVIWKIGNGTNKKKDNIMYAPGYLPEWKRATRTVTKIIHDTIYIEKKIIEKSPEVVVCKGLPDLPAIYFERGKSKLDTDKYAIQLFTIAQAMMSSPLSEIDILGFADHTGGEAINAKLTKKRAEALKKFLVKVGIDSSRIHTYGMGKDMKIEKELQFSEKARRTEIKAILNKK